jgi:hypothetical protein
MFNKKKGENMSMVGVKQRLQEEYDILTTKFSTYYSKINNKYKRYNPNLGFDQLGIKKAKDKLDNDSSLLYSIYFSLRTLEYIKPDLKDRA